MEQEERKLQVVKKREEDKREQHLRNIEEAKKVIVEEDSSLPIPKVVKIKDCAQYHGQRVKVHVMFGLVFSFPMNKFSTCIDL